MNKIGVSVAAIACNTAHVPKIFDIVKEKLSISGFQIKLLNIIESTVDYLKEDFLI